MLALGRYAEGERKETLNWGWKCNSLVAAVQRWARYVPKILCGLRYCGILQWNLWFAEIKFQFGSILLNKSSASPTCSTVLSAVCGTKVSIGVATSVPHTTTPTYHIPQTARAHLCCWTTRQSASKLGEHINLSHCGALHGATPYIRERERERGKGRELCLLYIARGGGGGHEIFSNTWEKKGRRQMRFWRHNFWPLLVK